MKKIMSIIIVLIIALALFFIFRNDSKKENKIKVAEVTHSVFYAPLYVAIENGYFEENGIDIELILASGADKVSAAVLSGDVQIGFAGAESAIYIYNGGEKDYPKIFSGLTKRDGQFILGRFKNNDFTLNDLKGKEILVGRKGGMPSLNFINALKNSGLNLKDVKLNYDVDFASLSGAFIGGTSNYVNLFEPNASMLEKNKQGYILTSIGKYSGEMPYTTFYARKSYINDNEKIINKFVKSISEGLKYTDTHTPKEIANVISKQFPDTSINDLELMIKNYKEADTWLPNTHITEDSFNNLQKLLIDNNLSKKYVPYEELIINYEKKVSWDTKSFKRV